MLPAHPAHLDAVEYGNQFVTVIPIPSLQPIPTPLRHLPQPQQTTQQPQPQQTTHQMQGQGGGSAAENVRRMIGQTMDWMRGYQEPIPSPPLVTPRVERCKHPGGLNGVYTKGGVTGKYLPFFIS